MKTFQPVIKWSGSKRSQANEIISYFPKEFETYYEPFCGGCSVLRALLESDIKVQNYVCTDNNHDLIILWKTIKLAPSVLASSYKHKWKELNKDEDTNRKKEFYETIRRRFNKEKNPMDFMFLDRTCYNGLIRYNSDGEFNTSFHLNRNGIEPSKFEKIIYEWSELLNQKKVIFLTKDYQNIVPDYYDFMYLDPPYNNTKGIYSETFNNEAFFNWLKQVKSGWAFSYDGISGNDDNTYNVPKEMYDNHVYLKSGNSSFKRIKGSDNNAMVYESLYIKCGYERD